MSSQKMHADELDTSPKLVRSLLKAQFPQWADLPIERVFSDGTENALYRLGDDMVVRLPLKQGKTEQTEKEHLWLPKLAPLLPLAIPLPLAKGEPSEDYPCQWSIYRWLQGENADIVGLSNLNQAAIDLAQFITTLHQIDPTGGPPPGQHNFHRGVSLAMRDAEVRKATASLGGMIDTDAVTQVWKSALQAPVWEGPPTWIHGDLKSDNLLVVDGGVSAVIDFGGLGVGDPACDTIIAWDLFSTETRQTFREALAVDGATWARGRGWALSIALIALPYYLNTNAGMVSYARRVLGEVLADSQYHS